jgi:hypothetical protein
VVLLAPEDRQAQLTHYLDLVEVSLLQQISSRQDSFFLALSNLQVCVEQNRANPRMS